MRRRPRQPVSAAMCVSVAVLCAGALAVRAQQPLPDPPGYAVPDDSLIPAGPQGELVRRGRAIVLATPDSLPRFVGNKLNCGNCHMDAGTRAASGPWVGVAGSFPQYNARADRQFHLEDRINECFRRSLNGRHLPQGSPDMAALVAYMRFLSTGIPQGTKPAWLGLKKLAKRAPSPAAGRKVFEETCVNCHGQNGEGTDAAPPLWGRESFAIGAGMARISTAAAFIRWNMPFDRPGTLTDQQAWDVAAYLLKHPRPDTPGKERDWPKGDAPEDCPYKTVAASHAIGK